MSPQTPNFYHNIANDYATMKNFPEAEKYYLEAIEADPNFIFSWQSLAGLYRTTNQTEKLAALAEKFKRQNR
jgi:tetratricopeptide (TPR) repeat protein